MTAKKTTEKKTEEKPKDDYSDGARIDALEEKVAALQDAIVSTFGIEVGPR